MDDFKSMKIKKEVVDYSYNDRGSGGSDGNGNSHPLPMSLANIKKEKLPWRSDFVAVRGQKPPGAFKIKCLFCPARFIRWHMGDHFRLYHPHIPLVQCTECPKEFLNEFSMERHIQDVHVPTRCQICKFLFKNKLECNSHHHAPKRPHQDDEDDQDDVDGTPSKRRKLIKKEEKKEEESDDENNNSKMKLIVNIKREPKDNEDDEHDY